MSSYISLYFKCYKLNTIKLLKGMAKSSSILNNEMNKKDKISCITKLDVPILLISGENDYICPVTATERWFNNLDASNKSFVKIKKAAHMVNFEQPDEWNNLLISILKNK